MSRAARPSARSAPDQIRRRALEHAPRHRRLMSSAEDGRRLSALMAPAYRLVVPPGHAVLTTTGRRSGLPREKVVRATRVGEVAYVVMLRPPAVAIEDPGSVAAWVLNIRSDPRVRIRLGRRTFAGRAREVDDESELDAVRSAICERVHLADFGECLIHLRGVPTPRRIRDLHAYWLETGIPVAIDLGEPI